MRVRDKVEQEKIVVERKGVEDKKSSGKDKDCVIF